MREPFAVRRLLIRSAILGFLVPVLHGEFWEGTAVHVVLALVIALVLYGLEKAVVSPFRTKPHIKPMLSAAYRGAVLYGLLVLGQSGDVYEGVGAGIAGGLIAMGLCKLEERILRRHIDVTPQEKEDRP